MSLRCVLTACLVWLAAPVEAREIVKLRSGASLAIDRHESDADGYWIYTRYGARFLAKQEVAAIVDPDAPPPAPAPVTAKPGSTQQMIDDAARRHGIPPAIVHAVATAESGYNQNAVSRSGAIGVMQLMPATAAALGANPRDQAENIDAGTRYLRSLLTKYQTSPDQITLALAAYNAGPTAVSRYGGVPPYRETRTYIRRVVGKYEQLSVTRQPAPKPESKPAPPPPPPAIPLPVAAAIVDKPTVSGMN